jgi:ABC-type transporter Mla subunit MlaD
VSSGDSSLGELAAHDRPLGATFSEIARLLPVMRDTFAGVQRLSGRLDPALAGLKPVTDSLPEGLAALQRFGRTATPALTALRPAVNDLRAMSRQLRPTAASLSRAFGLLTPQVPDYSKIVTLTDVCTTRLNRFFGNTQSVFKFADSNGAYPRADETIDLDSTGANVRTLNTRAIPNCTEKVGK